MISDPSQNPDPWDNDSENDSENNPDKYPDFSTTDVWADPPSEEPEEPPVINLKPKSEMEASIADEENQESSSDASEAEIKVTETTTAEVIETEAPIAEVNVSEVTFTEATPSPTIEPEPISEEVTASEVTQSSDEPTQQFNQPKDEREQLVDDVAQLRQQKEALEAEILELEAKRGNLLQENMMELQGTLGQLIQESLGELQQRKQALQISVEQLERRQERIRKEMQTTFAGVSQDLAIRVQGFKDYLVGSLQDLVTAAEELEIAPKERSPEPTPEPARSRSSAPRSSNRSGSPEFSDSTFDNQSQKIRRILKQFRTQPDYYGPPWQLRRTFEPIHAERVSNWFFTQGGRGALRSMGSRLQNILIASAIMSCLRKIYGNRFRTLVLANSPERLGEWRRGLQDCLGISRNDFGPERGVVLFEDPEALSQKAERLVKDGLMPLILIDEAEGQINLGILQFPLWLAFAAEPRMSGASSNTW
jgi:hypothetical protein